MMTDIEVCISSDSIAIYEHNIDMDYEIVSWIQQEWIDDPNTVISICNAIKLAYENPEELKRRLE
jgi:hypothetical protein